MCPCTVRKYVILCYVNLVKLEPMFPRHLFSVWFKFRIGPKRNLHNVWRWQRGGAEEKGCLSLHSENGDGKSSAWWTPKGMDFGLLHVNPVLLQLSLLINGCHRPTPAPDACLCTSRSNGQQRQQVPSPRSSPLPSTFGNWIYLLS
jgi:hypothetical protein